MAFIIATRQYLAATPAAEIYIRILHGIDSCKLINFKACVFPMNVLMCTRISYFVIKVLHDILTKSGFEWTRVKNGGNREIDYQMDYQIIRWSDKVSIANCERH